MNALLRTALALSLALALPCARASDLLDVYRLAVRNDAQLQVAAQARLAVLQTRPESRAGLLPALNFNLDVNRTQYDNKLNSTLDYATNQSYSLQLTQPLFDWAAWKRLSQADSRIAQADAEYAAARQDLMLRVAVRYFGVLKARSALEFVRADLKATRRQLEQARKRFRVGLSAITDVREAQARYDAVAAREIVARNALDSAREALEEITGVPIGRLDDLAGKLALVRPRPAVMKDWVDTALQHNLQVLARLRAVDVAQREIGVQRSGHYPKVDLVAGTQYLDQTAFGLFPLRQQQSSIGVEMRLPLFLGGAVTARTRQAAHLYSEAQDRLLQAQRATVRATRDAYRDVLAGIARVEALHQAVVSARTALQATEAGYKVGTRTIVDVLDFQRNLYSAESDYAAARYDYLVSTLRLKQAAGTLSADDLVRLNRDLGAPGS